MRSQSAQTHLEFIPTIRAEGVFTCPKYPRMGQCKLNGRTMIPIPGIRASTMGNLGKNDEKAIRGNVYCFTYELLDDLESAVTGSI